MCHRLVQQACSGTDPALPVQLPHTRILVQLKKGKPLPRPCCGALSA